jgi:hypothetical protein
MKKQNMNFIKVMLCSLSSVLLLVGCGGGSSDNPQTVIVTPEPMRSITGAVSKSPLSGATVSFFAVDSSGFATGSALVTGTTDADGNFAVELPATAPDVLIETNGGSFVDESDPSGATVIQLTADQGFLSILSASASVVAVTPFTQALVESAREGAKTSGAFITDFGTGVTELNANTGFDVMATIPSNPLDPAVADSESQKKYALMLGGVATAASNVAQQLGESASSFDIIKAVIDDMADGSLDGMKFDNAVTVGSSTTVIPANIDLDAEINNFQEANSDAFVDVVLPVFDATPRPPVAVNDTASTAEDTPLTSTTDLDANDTDADSETLTVVGGTFATAGGGSLVLADSGSYTYTPALNFNGDDTVKYTVTDGALTSEGTLTINVTPVNDGPAAVNDTASTAEDTPLTSTTDLDANDTDADSETLTVVGGTFATAGGGSLVLADSGSYTYTPALNFNGNDTIKYTVTDGALTSEGTLAITVTSVNDSPVAVATVATEAQQGALVTLTGSDSTDIDGTLASYAWTQVSGTTVSLNDSTAVSPGFQAPDTVETLTFQLQVADSGGLTSAAEASISVVGIAPVAVAPNVKAQQQQTVTLDASGSTDNLGITSYQWLQVAGASVTLSDAANVAPTFVAPAASLIAGQLLEFDLTVTDKDSLSSTARVNIEVEAPLPLRYFGLRESATPFQFGVGIGLFSGFITSLNADGTGQRDYEESQNQFTWTESGNQLTGTFTDSGGWLVSTSTGFPTSEDCPNQCEIRTTRRFLGFVQSIVTDTSGRDVVMINEQYTVEAFNVTNSTVQSSVTSEESYEYTLYDLTQTEPLGDVAGTTRSFETYFELPSQIVSSSVTGAPLLSTDTLTFEADGTGNAARKASSFTWQLDGSSHLLVDFANGEKAEYFQLNETPTGTVVGTIYSYPSGKQHVRVSLSLVDDPAVVFSPNNIAGYYRETRATALDDGTIVATAFYWRINSDGTGRGEFPNVDVADGVITSVSRSSFGICASVDASGLMTWSRAFRGIDTASRESFFARGAFHTPEFCQTLTTSQISWNQQYQLFDEKDGLLRTVYNRSYNNCGVTPTSDPSPEGCNPEVLDIGFSIPGTFTRFPYTSGITPPTAEPDSVTAAVGTALAIDVLANDVVGSGGLDPASLVLDVAPRFGTAVIEPTTGTITYTAAAGAIRDSIVYRVSDTLGNVTFGLVSITVGS